MKKLLALCFCSLAHVALGAEPVCTIGGSACDLLNKWYNEGTAAGNNGDFYDNRDRGHSSLDTEHYPQLQEVTYTANERLKRADWAGQTKIRKQIIVGNSSTSGDVRTSGSNVRAFYYATPLGLAFLYSQYQNNNLYIYPSHHDYLPGHDGHPGFGDVYPTNTPYTISSLGSSGSDKAFLAAFLQTLAALHPEVKQKLAAKGMLMPTIQYIFRRSNRPVHSDADYLSGIAHPTVFSGDDIDLDKMILMAHDLQLGTVPPQVSLEVLSEDPVDNSFYAIQGSEIIGDTPAAIARVWKGPSYQKRFVLTARRSYDLNYKPLTYSWVILRGDSAKIKITPINNGETAEIVVDYQERQPISKDSPISSNRIDIGVFANNGTSYSAPAFFTLYTLDNEGRTYDKAGRLIEIYFNATDLGVTITDWSALFKLIASQEDVLPSTLIQQQLTQEQKEALKNLAQQLEKPLSTIATIQASVTNGVQATDIQRKTIEESKAKIEELISTPLPTLNGQTATVFIEKTFKSLIADPTFFTTHAATLQSWIQKAPQEVQERIQKQLQKLISMGLLAPTATKEFVVNTPHPFDNGTALPLTKYEQFQLAHLNLIVIGQVLYPNVVFPWESVNFVDPRLTTPNATRWIYEYSGNGPPKKISGDDRE